MKMKYFNVDLTIKPTLFSEELSKTVFKTSLAKLRPTIDVITT